MGIDDYKTKIHAMVDEIFNLDFVIQIYTVTRILYSKFQRDE